MNNRLAIILVNYNGIEYNINCINSIMKSKFKDYKIIVVDNNSQDDSVKVLKEHYKNEEIILIESKENLGFSGANNIGIEYAKDNDYNYVMLLNNDTIIDENMISIMLETSKKYNCLVSPKIYYFDNEDIIWSAGGSINWKKGLPIQYGINEKDEKQHDKEKFIEFATGCCLLIPIDAINKVGGLSEEYFLYYEDTDYSAKIIKEGFKILYKPEAFMYHKVSASTGGEKSISYWYYMTRNRLIFNKKFSKYKVLNNLYFYSTTVIKTIKYLINKNIIALKGTYMGIFDYLKGKTGKKTF